ncbi:MAG: thioredoxin family protein [Holophagaceae bacterium]
MKAAVLALGALVLPAHQGISAQPARKLPAGSQSDPPDHRPLLLGEVTAEAILAHRPAYRDNLAKVKVNANLKARWAAIRQPFALVAVFGSWCADSQYHLPYLLALEAEPNPFIEVHYLGVNRDKKLDPGAWPKGVPPQALHRVPTFYLFATRPGSAQKLVGTVVENPPREGQSMAEALVVLVETVAKAL